MKNQFPTVRGSNLLRQNVTLPADFEGKLNVVLVAFQQWQQQEVDTWLPLLSQLEEQQPDLRYYELPTIQGLSRLNQWFINEGMRAGIRNHKTRSKTITLYLDKPTFRTALDMPHEETIHVLLVDHQGLVLWRSTGPLDETKGQALVEAIEQETLKANENRS